MSTAPKLTEGLAAAWADRGRRALSDLEYAQKAPALFKPEWSKRAKTELITARQNIAYWLAIGGE